MQRGGNIQGAIKQYKYLYEKSSKTAYLIEATRLAFLNNMMDQNHELLQSALQKEPNNEELRRILIGTYTRQDKLKLAEKEVQKLLGLNKNAQHLRIAGNIYLQKQEYNLALKYFESAYKKSKNDETLLSIVDLLYNYLDKKEEAIAHLETHIRMQRCETKTCYKLIQIYGKEKNIDGIISTYKKLYDRFGHEEYAKKVIELYMYQKDKNQAISFLEKSGYNQNMLLDIYVASNDFKNAYTTAEKLYKKTADIDYLGKMAIYEYENKRNDIDAKTLKSVSEKFEKVVKKIHDPLYLNYYGYLLIDHDLDIKKGIELVKSALLKEPNSPFYLDSLAWGLYKEGKCKEAKEIMQPLMKTNEEEEVAMHYEKIKECLEKERQ